MKKLAKKKVRRLTTKQKAVAAIVRSLETDASFRKSVARGMVKTATSIGLFG